MCIFFVLVTIAGGSTKVPFLGLFECGYEDSKRRYITSVLRFSPYDVIVVYKYVTILFVEADNVSPSPTVCHLLLKIE